MRVIAGRYRGLPLEAPPGDVTRPITDRAKESLFNILGARFAEPGVLPPFDVLDVFAGSGGLGIECLSRGARRCWFVEREPKALRTLRKNIAKLRLAPDVARVIPASAWTARFPALPDGFGLAFVDPPYRDSEDTAQALDLLERLAPRLAPDGVVVFRLSARTAFDSRGLRGLSLADEREFGTMRVLLLAAPARSIASGDSIPSPNDA